MSDSSAQGKFHRTYMTVEWWDHGMKLEPEWDHVLRMGGIDCDEAHVTAREVKATRDD